MNREERYISGFNTCRDAVGRLFLYRDGFPRYVWSGTWGRWLRIRTFEKVRKPPLYVAVISGRIHRLLTIAAFPEIAE